MKKLLLLPLLLPFLACAQAVPADASQFENIQLTNSGTDIFATEVVVKSSNDVLSTISKDDLISRSTGLAQGGTLSINTDATKFNFSAGFGYIVNGHSNPANQTATRVNWTARTANVVPNIASQKQTYVAIDINGNLFLTANPLTATQRRNYIRLGVLIHLNNSVIEYTDNQPTISIELGGQVQDILEFLGFKSISGNRIFPVGANLKIKKELGTVFKPGANFNNLTTQPHSFILPAQDPITFKYRTQTGAEGSNITDINPAIYDNNGTITAMPATATLASIQRIFVFQDNSIRIQPGQRFFNNLNEAITAINSDIFISDSDVANNGLFLGSIVLIRGTTALNTLSQAIFVPSQGTSANGSVAAAPIGYTPEDVANKQNNLNTDGTGAKYPTVDAINAAVVKLTGNQTLNGTKTFSSPIIGSLTGNADTSTKAVFVSLTENTTDNNYPVTFSDNAGVNNSVLKNANLSYNPSNKLLTGVNSQFTGSVTINNGATDFQAVNKRQLDLKADLISPTFTGEPTAPTAAVGTNTTQLATTAFVQGIRPYKVYAANISQSGTAAPTVNYVLENAIGAVVWSYNAAARYDLTLTGAFPADKTMCFITNGGSTTVIRGTRLSINIFRIQAEADNLIIDASIEIRVYN